MLFLSLLTAHFFACNVGTQRYTLLLAYKRKLFFAIKQFIFPFFYDARLILCLNVKI